MEKTVNTNNYGAVKLSGEETDIINLITKIRNDLIRDFLDERFLKEHFNQKFHVYEISPIKIEFIKKDLKEYFASPIRIEHYQGLIEEIQQNETTSLVEEQEQIFYRDVETLFHKYF